MMSKESLEKDIKEMEQVYQQYSVQLEQFHRMREQQSGAIQYARMLLAKFENEEEKAEVPATNHQVPLEEL